ncbi:MAG: dockerin type I repeat-containing protein, partial [Clostridia bacterium]|nr:dockerin type I repeat-containing protein [Clostridia bacterium]
MKKNILRVSAFLLAVIVSLTCVQCSFFAVETTTPDFIKDCKTGDIIKFGSYPQGEVYNIDLIASLDAVEKTWVSYNYYSGDNNLIGGGMTPSDFMQYADFDYNGTTYRAVTFSKFRPTQTSLDNSDEHVAAYQNKYGYECGQVYYFKYEPLEWRVLDPANGLIMCASVIDSQPLNNYYIYAKMPNTEYGNSLCWANPELTVYAADYTKSDLRTWLNADFYKSAFSALEQSKILTSAIDNSPKSNQITEDVYVDYPETNDKVFLLSLSDVTNEKYGFNSDELYEDNARILTPTDYAKCQGIALFDGTDSTMWRLRTAYGLESTGVYFTGAATGGSFSYSTFDGVVPAIAVNPEASLTRAEKGDLDSDGFVNSTDALMVLQYSVDLRELNDMQKLSADIDNDKTINSYDALLMLRYSVGMDEGFGYLPENTEPETPANKYALNSTDKAQILEYYKSIYRHNAGRRFSKTLEIKDFNSGDDLTPLNVTYINTKAEAE